MTDILKQGNQYIHQLFAILHKHINPALFYVLHNDGPHPDTDYRGIPRDPKLLYLYLSTPQSRSIIQRLRQRRIITQHHYNLLFPPGCVETDSQKFDPFLKQIMIRNFTTLKTDNGRWNIDQILPDDTSVAANTVRAVAFRNFVNNYGNPADMKKTEFDYKFKQADTILKGLKCKGIFSSVKTMSFDQKISVLRALNCVVKLQTNKLAHDTSATDNTIKRLTTDVSKIQDEISAFEMSLNQDCDSAPDQLMDQVHKVLIDIESIKDEMSRKTVEEIDDPLEMSRTEGGEIVGQLFDRLKNVQKQQQEKSKWQ